MLGQTTAPPPKLQNRIVKLGSGTCPTGTAYAAAINEPYTNFTFILVNCSPVNTDRTMTIVLCPGEGLTPGGQYLGEQVSGSPTHGVKFTAGLPSNTSTITITGFQWGWGGSWTTKYVIFGIR